MCELMAMCFERPLYADISIRAFAVRDVENADGWGLAWYPDRSLAIAKEPLMWTGSEYAEFLQTYAHLYSNLYIGHVRNKTMGGPNTRADSHPFTRELFGREYCFAHNGTIRTAHRDLPARRFQPIGSTDSEQVFCHLLEEIARRSARVATQAEPPSPPSDAPPGRMRSLEGPRPHRRQDLGSRSPLALTADHRWLHEKASAINRMGKFNMLLADGERLCCYHDVNGFKGLWVCDVPTNSHRSAHHLDDPTIHVDFETDAANSGVIVATVPLNTNPLWRRFAPGEMIVAEAGRIVYADVLGEPAKRS